MSIYAKNNGTWVPVGPAVNISAEGTPGAPTILNPEGGSVIKFTAAPEGAAGPNLAHGASISPNDNGEFVNVDQDNFEVAVLGTTPFTDYVVSVYGVNEAGRGDSAKTAAFQLNYNDATGGKTVEEYTNLSDNTRWRYHEFDWGTRTFTVKENAADFRVLVVGGGGGGRANPNGWSGGGGSGGEYWRTIPVGDHSATVGVAGKKDGGGEVATDGGDSTFLDITGAGGKKGNDNSNGAPGWNTESDIKGTSEIYGFNPPRYYYDTNYDSWARGHGGGGGKVGGNHGYPGMAGLIVIAYQIGTSTTRQIEQAQAEAAARQAGVEQGIQQGYSQAQEDLQEELSTLRTQISGAAGTTETMLIDGKEQKVTRKGRRK